MDDVFALTGDIQSDAEVELDIETEGGDDFITHIQGNIDDDADVEIEIDGGDGFDSRLRLVGTGWENIDYDIDDVESHGVATPPV